jgi:hypothetical protein
MHVIGAAVKNSTAAKTVLQPQIDVSTCKATSGKACMPNDVVSRGRGRTSAVEATIHCQSPLLDKGLSRTCVRLRERGERPQ